MASLIWSQILSERKHYQNKHYHHTYQPNSRPETISKAVSSSLIASYNSGGYHTGEILVQLCDHFTSVQITYSHIPTPGNGTG